MAAIFGPAANLAAKVVLLTIALAILGGVALWGLWPRTDYARNLRSAVAQPVPFSHQHHVAGPGTRLPLLPHLGRGVGQCRFAADLYLHDLPFAGLDQRGAAGAGARSLANDTPIVWHRVTDLPDYVYFNHSIHIAKGVGCASCHGAVATMPMTYKAKALTMEFCLDCHRNPGPTAAAESGPSTTPSGIALRRHAVPAALMARITCPTATSPIARYATDERHRGSVAQPRTGRATILHSSRARHRSSRGLCRFAPKRHRPAPGAAVDGARRCDGRRDGLRLASFGADLIPAVRMPPNIIPRLPNSYATAHVLDGYACGIVVRHVMGRPVQGRGQLRSSGESGRDWTCSRRRSCSDFYDPDRCAGVDRPGRANASGRALETALHSAARRIGGDSRRGPAGPHRHRHLAHAARPASKRCCTAYPDARWRPVGAGVPRCRSPRARCLRTGGRSSSWPHLDKVDVLVSHGQRPVEHGPGPPALRA